MTTDNLKVEAKSGWKFFTVPPRPLQRLSLIFGAYAVGFMLAALIWPVSGLAVPLMWGYGFITTWILDVAIEQWKS